MIGMKKVVLCILLTLVVLAGCGVKSSLQHPGDYPRDYPVY